MVFLAMKQLKKQKKCHRGHWKAAFLLLFKNRHEAFNRLTKKEDKGDGIWVYYDSYAEFKKQQQKAKRWGFGLLGASAFVCVLFFVNLCFPVIFKSGASFDYAWQMSDLADWQKGTPDSGIDLYGEPGRLRLKPGKALEEISGRGFGGGYSLPGEAFYAAQIGMMGVTPNACYAYNQQTSPALADAKINYVFMLGQSIYAGTDRGLDIVDTKLTNSPEDDTIKNLSMSSEPALSSNLVFHASLGDGGRYLYVGTWGGLDVVDVVSNKKVAAYNSVSSPALPYNKVQHSFLDSRGLLYVSTNGGGLSVVDTKQTPAQADDVAVAWYGKQNGFLGSDRVYHAWLDEASGLLYVSTWSGGLSIVDTKQTVDPQDDVLLSSFNASSHIAIAGEKVKKSIMIDGRLFVAAYGDGLYEIAINDPLRADDDVLLNRFTARNGSLPSDDVSDIYFDQKEKVLAVSTYSGVSLFDVSGETLPIERFDESSSPALLSASASSVWSDGTRLIVGSEEDGLQIVDRSKQQKLAAYVSQPIDNRAGQARLVEAETLGGKTTVSVRCGQDKAVWEEHFVGEVSGRVKSAGASYVYKDGFLEVRGRGDVTLAASESVDFFPAGSVVRFRVRSLGGLARLSVYADDWEGAGKTLYVSQDWQIVRLFPKQAFSRLGLSASLLANQSLLVDWVSIENELGWSAWRVGADGQRAVDSNCPWLQYRLSLEAESGQIPAVRKVYVWGHYPEKGVYISEIIDGGEQRLWHNIQVEATVPEESSLEVQYRTALDPHTWSDWRKASPDLAASSRYLQYKLVLGSSSGKQTPEISSVRVDCDNTSSGAYGVGVMVD
jgi:hypothetical protein